MSETDMIAERPAHVPQELVFQFDIHHDPELLVDPHRRIRELATMVPPLFWTPCNGGHWLAMRHADVFRIYRDTRNFSSSPISPERKAMMLAAIPPGTPRMIELTPIMMDPPEHTKYRLPLQKAFGPKTMMGLKAEIEELANCLIDEVIDSGGCDFFASVNEQLPVRIFLKMMGLPSDRLAEFRELVREVFTQANDPMEAARRVQRIVTAMSGEIEARRNDPKDDLISLLWSLTIDGKPMTAALMEDYAALLFLAGLDTVINGMSFGMRHLAMDLQLQRALRANPERIADATEELLRYYTFTVSQRRVTEDIEFEGQLLKAGDMVVLYLPAAGIDPAHFSDPVRFDPDRNDKSHLAFGAGPHRCLGAHLARIELQTLYEVVLRRLPEFRLDPDHPPVFHAGMMLSLSSLPIRWD